MTERAVQELEAVVWGLPRGAAVLAWPRAVVRVLAAQPVQAPPARPESARQSGAVREAQGPEVRAEAGSAEAGEEVAEAPVAQAASLPSSPPSLASTVAGLRDSARRATQPT